MSLSALTSIHKIHVLQAEPRREQNMDMVNSFKRIRTLDCRVVPLSVTEAIDLFVRGQEVSHRIYFSVDPGSFTGRDMIEFDGMILDVIGEPINVHNLNRMWTLMANKKTRHQEPGARILGP